MSNLPAMDAQCATNSSRIDVGSSPFLNSCRAKSDISDVHPTGWVGVALGFEGGDMLTGL